MPGTLPASVDQIVAQLLVDAGLGNARITPTEANQDQPEWPVSYDNEPSYPNNILHVNDTAGILFQGDSHGGRNEWQGVQIVIRGGTRAVTWPKVNIVRIYIDQFKVNGPRVVTVDGEQYCIGGLRRASGPLRIGPSGNNTLRKYTINALVHVSLFSA